MEENLIGANSRDLLSRHSHLSDLRSSFQVLHDYADFLLV